MGRRRLCIGRLRPRGTTQVSGYGRRASAIPEIPRPLSSPLTRCPTPCATSRPVPRTRFNSSPCWTPKRASLTPAGISRQVYKYLENYYECFMSRIDIHVWRWIICRAEHPGKVHRLVQERDDAAGAMATALSGRDIHTLQS